MRELRREDFEERLKQLPSPLVAAFTLRAAISILPALDDGQQPFLGFWLENDRGKYLLTMFRALYVAYGAGKYLSVSDIIANDVYTSVERMHGAVTNTIYTGYAIANATRASSNVTTHINNVAYAAHAVADATRRYGINLSEVFFNELLSLTKDENIIAYLQRPIPLAKGSISVNSSGRYSLIVGDNKPTDHNTICRHFFNRIREYGEGFDWWARWLEDRLAGKSIDWALMEKTLSLDKSLLSQGPVVVNAYLKSLSTGIAILPLNRVRAIFIGHGLAGKTSLIRALHGEEIILGREEMTPGVAIRDWPLPDSDIKAHLWDFGGQVMAHATHKFFLREKCVYVLVMDGREVIDANQQAEYWLEHVRAFGGDAPVLLVGNKIELAPVNLDMHYLKERYPNIIDYFPLSCLNYRGSHRKQFQIFRNVLAGQLAAIGTHQILLTLAHFQVFEQLQELARRDAFLSTYRYQQLCEAQGIVASGELDQAWLLDLLDKLGQVVHFPHIPVLDGYVLNPRWLTYGVYSVLYAVAAKQGHGMIGKKSVVEILKNAELNDEQGHRLNYPADKCSFILEAMEQFEICYRLPNKADSYMLPDLLPSDRPEDVQFDKNQALVFDFDFEGLLPRHL